MKRGEIYWIEPSTYKNTVGCVQGAGRPGIIVQNDTGNENSYTTEIVYLTTSPKTDLPTHCTINSAREPSTALCEQITTIDVEQLGDYIGKCSPGEMMAVDICLSISLGLAFGEPQKKTVKKKTSEEKTSDTVVKQLEERLAEADTEIEKLKERIAEADLNFDELQKAYINAHNDAIQHMAREGLLRELYDSMLKAR